MKGSKVLSMKTMKVFLVMVLLFLTIGIVNCNGQPKNDYEIVATPVVGTTTYHFFAEKKNGTNPYLLTQGMDYLNPSVVSLKIGTSATPYFVTNLNNDGSEYRVGVVAENVAGFYSGMGVATGNVGTVPVTPAGVIFRKKQ